MRSLLAVGGFLFVTPALAGSGSDALRLVGERQALASADAACGLLEPGPRAALEAGLNQAIQAALRAGAAEAEIGRRREAAAAAGLACDDPALLAAAETAKVGFAAWSRRHAMEFPGLTASWRVRRTPDPEGWFLWQDIAGGARLGLHRSEAGSRLLLQVGSQAALAGARLRLRDAARSRPPAGLGTTILATRSEHERNFLAKQRLTEGKAVRFEFDSAALAALAALDSREHAVIELEPRAGGAIRLKVEAGDLAAAIAFLRAEPR